MVNTNQRQIPQSLDLPRSQRFNLPRSNSLPNIRLHYPQEETPARTTLQRQRHIQSPQGAYRVRNGTEHRVIASQESMDSIHAVESQASIDSIPEIVTDAYVVNEREDRPVIATLVTQSPPVARGGIHIGGCCVIS